MGLSAICISGLCVALLPTGQPEYARSDSETLTMHKEAELELELDPVELVLLVPGFCAACELAEDVPVVLLLVCGAGGATLGGGAGAGAACTFCNPLARNDSAVKAAGMC